MEPYLKQYRPYFCETCNRVILPFELQSCVDKDGKNDWIHMDCEKQTVIRIDPEEEPEVTTIDDIFE